VTRLEVSGRVLRSVIEQGLRRDYGLPNFSGVSLTAALGPPPDATLLEVSVNGQPLDDHATYSLATGSFTATGGEGYEQLPAHIEIQLDLSVADAIAHYINEHSPLAVPPPGRQRMLSSTTDLPGDP
jgi:5'-nucleotidase/UDP-sugar diphosphatase